MTLPSATFRCLSLCAQRPGSVVVTGRLPAALDAVPSLREFADAAEDHGLEPLVLAHLRAGNLTLPRELRERLVARAVQHAHAAAVRTRVVADVVSAMERADVPFLFLKGAALAYLVYGDARLRPMRDVDLLIRKRDAGRALDVLTHCGFKPGGPPVPSGHHHLQGMAKTLDGATVTIELHHELIARTPFVEPRDYDDVIRRSQSFDWGGKPCRTLGCEDMLWHVYAHAFVINPLRPGAIRLLSVADLVHATEAWIDRIDWTRFPRQYGRLVRALHVLHDLVPWSPRVAEVLRDRVERTASAVSVYPINSDPFWSAALIPDVLWPPEWWFRMRYGITGWARWAWFRGVGHPAHLALAGMRAVSRRAALRTAPDEAALVPWNRDDSHNSRRW